MSRALATRSSDPLPRRLGPSPRPAVAAAKPAGATALEETLQVLGVDEDSGVCTGAEASAAAVGNAQAAASQHGQATARGYRMAKSAVHTDEKS